MCTVIPSLFLSNIFTFNQTELVRKQSTCSFSLHFLSINSLLLIIFFIPFPHKDMHVLPPEEKLSVLADHSENRHALRKDQLTVYWLKKPFTVTITLLAWNEICVTWLTLQDKLESRSKVIWEHKICGILFLRNGCRLAASIYLAFYLRQCFLFLVGKADSALVFLPVGQTTTSFRGSQRVLKWVSGSVWERLQMIPVFCTCMHAIHW